MNAAVQPIPEMFRTITPHLVVRGAADAIDFYRRAFDAREVTRMPGPSGKLMHAQVQIGDSQLMLVDEFPEAKCLGPLALNGTPVSIHLYLPDADAAFRQATEAGAKVIMAPTDMPWGDRYAQVEDPFGHRWSLATHVRDLTHEQIAQGLQEMMSHPDNCPGEQA
jgi:uncharacterized glyoxalase superfamily protein PhnB